MAFKEPTRNQLRSLVIEHLKKDLAPDVISALAPNQMEQVVNSLMRFFDKNIKFKTSHSLVQETVEPDLFLDALDKL
jgi:hypothetical protein